MSTADSRPDIIILPAKPPAGIMRGIVGRQYSSGRIEWTVQRSDVRQAHKRQCFRARCMSLQNAQQDAAQALHNAAVLRRLLFPQRRRIHTLDILRGRA